MQLSRSEIRDIFRTEVRALLDEYRPIRPLLSVDGVARVLGVSRRTVESMIANGVIRPVKVGRQRRFSPAAIDAYIRSLTK